MSREDPKPFAAPVASVERSAVQGTELAERGERLYARVLDDVIALGVFIPGLVVALGVTVGTEASSDDLFFLPVPLVWALGVGLVAFFGVTFYQWYLIATRGQTIGKRVYKLRVVTTDGRPVGFVDGVLLREWVMGALTAIPLLGYALWVVDPLMIFGAERRCLHDVIASTKVIRARN